MQVFQWLKSKCKKLSRSWFPQKTNNEFGIQPPTELQNKAGWEKFWQSKIFSYRGDIQTQNDALLSNLFLSQDLPTLRDRGAESALIIGNGLSMMPYVLQHLGFETVVIELSELATQFVQSYNFSEADIDLLFQIDEKGNIGKFAKHYFQPHGSLEFICGDFLDPNIAKRHFDFVYSCRTLQCFSLVDLGSAIQAIDSRVGENGYVCVLIQNNEKALNQILSLFQNLGYNQSQTNKIAVCKLGVG